jgi:aspartyl-tRNA(Asn)/glutamyl-tRNA(Gln) amidotransferase subunit A
MRSGFSDPLVAAGVAKLAALFASHAATPLDALDVYLGRIDRLNPELNAFLAVDREGAARDAKASRQRWAKGTPRSALDGAPLGIKVNIAVKGMPWHAGIAAYDGRMAPADAACVAALRDAGAVILGVLNMHEAGLGATNDNLQFGRCHNPYRHDFTPGGSSGGGAAAVAAGLCAAAVGTDTLGSVRIPAAYCGVLGHKPTHGLISTEGVVPLSWTLDDVGVIARSLQDCRAMVELLARDDADLGQTPPRDRAARVGVLARGGVPPLDEAVAKALSGAVQTAEDAGALIEAIEPAWDWTALRLAGLMVVEVEANVEHGAVMARNPGGFSPAMRSMLQWAGRQSAPKTAQAYRTLTLAAEDIRETLSRFDVLLLPATATPAFPFDDPAPNDQADFTMLANIAGLAATAFPTELSEDGLPVGLQVVSQSDRTALHWAERLSRPLAAPAGFRK